MLTHEHENNPAIQAVCQCNGANEAREVLNHLLPAENPTLFLETVNDAIGCVIILGTEYERGRWKEYGLLLNGLTGLRDGIKKGAALVNGKK